MMTLKTNMVTSQDYYLLVLIVWCTKIKRNMLIKSLVRTRKCLVLAITLRSKNYYDDSNKLVAVIMKYEIGGGAIKEFVFLVDHSSKQK